MRGCIWLMAGALVLLGVITGSKSDVSPSGTYTHNGKYVWNSRNVSVWDTVQGTMTLNRFKFYGNATSPSVNAIKSRFVLNQKVSAQVNSVRTVTGTITTSTRTDTQVYDVINGKLTFKITSNDRIKYSGTVKGKITAGTYKGQTLTVSYKGVHQ